MIAFAEIVAEPDRRADEVDSERDLCAERALRLFRRRLGQLLQQQAQRLARVRDEHLQQLPGVGRVAHGADKPRGALSQGHAQLAVEILRSQQRLQSAQHLVHSHRVAKQPPPVDAEGAERLGRVLGHERQLRRLQCQPEAAQQQIGLLRLQPLAVGAAEPHRRDNQRLRLALGPPLAQTPKDAAEQILHVPLLLLRHGHWQRAGLVASTQNALEVDVQPSHDEHGCLDLLPARRAQALAKRRHKLAVQELHARPKHLDRGLLAEALEVLLLQLIALLPRGEVGRQRALLDHHLVEVAVQRLPQLLVALLQRRILYAAPEVDGELCDSEVCAEHAHHEGDDGEQRAVGGGDDVHGALGEGGDDAADVARPIVHVAALERLLEPKVGCQLDELRAEPRRILKRARARRAQLRVRG
mmetsp:Transcript_41135/g.90309  ORF Transcript_41135/g.90309 Transcript_41135/m.90309 type:complete len:414 (+) Transcript_41135:630-1871(+)